MTAREEERQAVTKFKRVITTKITVDDSQRPTLW